MTEPRRLSVSPTVRDDPRCAGAVLRYHTWPMLNQQSVADHAWNVSRLLLAIWPEAPRHLIVEALFHDNGEVASGDSPFPIKRDNPTLKMEMDRIERNGRLAMVLPWTLPAPTQLTPLEHWVLKVADMLDMWECGLKELMMGNRFAELIVTRTSEFLFSQIDTVPQEDARRPIADATAQYMIRRKSAWQF